MNAEQLKHDVEEQRNLLNTDRLDLSFGEIISLYERKDLIIKPAFQRYFRWHEEQRSRFIESILLGIPIPPIFVAEDTEGVWELVDGLQRVSTVLSFFGLLKANDEGIRQKNNWMLTSGDRVTSLEGFNFQTLPIALQRNIKRATCRVEILRWNSNYDMRFELFNRLNTGGSPLTPQEIRNCIYRDISSKFNDFLQELANEPIFKELISLSFEQYEQLYHEELALRFISLYNNSGNIKISIAHHMTEFMKSALENESFDYTMYRNVFMEVFALLSPLKKGIFRQRDGRFATSLYDVITLGVADNLNFYKTQDLQIIKNKIDNEVRQDAVLLRFSRKGGNNQIARIKNRIKEAKRIFSNG